MKKLFLLTFLISSHSFANFICLANSVGGYYLETMGSIDYIGTKEKCMEMLQNSKNGFICIESHNHRRLINKIAFIAGFSETTDCLKLVNKSKNGFICAPWAGGYRIYSSESAESLKYFPDIKTCQDALENSI